jgi:hypothetical protein
MLSISVDISVVYFIQLKDESMQAGIIASSFGKKHWPVQLLLHEPSQDEQSQFLSQWAFPRVHTSNP